MALALVQVLILIQLLILVLGTMPVTSSSTMQTAFKNSSARSPFKILRAVILSFGSLFKILCVIIIRNSSSHVWFRTGTPHFIQQLQYTICTGT